MLAYHLLKPVPEQLQLVEQPIQLVQSQLGVKLPLQLLPPLQQASRIFQQRSLQISVLSMQESIRRWLLGHVGIAIRLQIDRWKADRTGQRRMRLLVVITNPAPFTGVSCGRSERLPVGAPAHHGSIPLQAPSEPPFH